MTSELSTAVGLHLTSVVESVYQTMLGATARPASTTGCDFESPLTAAVYYVGAWQGALVLECSAAQAERWAGLLMPLTPPLSREDTHDGLGELTNMIAGNLKPMLPPGISLSMPSVIEGSDHKLHLLGTRLCEALTFADESGPFRIGLLTLAEKAAQ